MERHRTDARAAVVDNLVYSVVAPRPYSNTRQTIGTVLGSRYVFSPAVRRGDFFRPGHCPVSPGHIRQAPTGRKARRPSQASKPVRARFSTSVIISVRGTPTAPRGRIVRRRWMVSWDRRVVAVGVVIRIIVGCDSTEPRAKAPNPIPTAAPGLVPSCGYTQHNRAPLVHAEPGLMEPTERPGGTRPNQNQCGLPEVTGMTPTVQYPVGALAWAVAVVPAACRQSTQ